MYLGKEIDPSQASENVAREGEPSAKGKTFDLDPADLTTHGLILGMTGSGKTGLGIVMIEEALRAGIPVVAIDPKGDLGNLLLAFDRLAPAQFAPWIDAEAARRAGKDIAAVARDTAEAWGKGLAEWGLTAADVSAYASCHDALILTPGSNAGLPVNLIASLAPPRIAFASAEEELRDEIDSIVSALLGLVGIEAEPLKSRDYILLFKLIEEAWRADQGYTLETLIAAVGDPPFGQVGALGLEAFFPRRQRQELMLALNNLLASPPFEIWRQGMELNVAAWLEEQAGKPRLTVIYTAHLEDRERLAITALVLNKLKTWMRRQTGTGTLRALIYIDEIFGYFPPVANPPTKKPLLALLKTARAFGMGIVLATQNPVDLDYKGLANIGFWAIGKLQTEQDRERVRAGLSGALSEGVAEFEALLSRVAKRVFVVHNVHRRGPILVASRWALSYLRGPLSREEVARLMAMRRDDAEPTVTRLPRALRQGLGVDLRDALAAPSGAASSQNTVPGGAASRTAAPSPSSLSGASSPPAALPFRQRFLKCDGGEVLRPHLLVKFAARYRTGRGQGGGAEEKSRLLAFPLVADALGEALEGSSFDVRESELGDSPPAGALGYAEIPRYMTGSDGRAIERLMRERLPDKLEITVFEDPASGMLSAAGEGTAEFVRRVAEAHSTSAARKELEEKLARKRATLEIQQRELDGRRSQKLFSIGRILMDGFGVLLGGRRRSSRPGAGLRRVAAGVGTAVGKNRMENATEARVEGLAAEVAALEGELAALGEVRPERFTERTLHLSKDDLTILRTEILWVW